MSDQSSDSETEERRLDAERQLMTSEPEQLWNVTIAGSPHRPTYAQVTSRREVNPPFSEMPPRRNNSAIPIWEQSDVRFVPSVPPVEETEENKVAWERAEHEAHAATNGVRRRQRVDGFLLTIPESRRTQLEARLNFFPRANWPWWWEQFGHLVTNPTLKVVDSHEAWATIFRFAPLSFREFNRKNKQIRTNPSETQQ